MSKPFGGIRILDFTRYLAGPFGSYQLALLGADVIKIEPRAGDEMRRSQLSKEWTERGLAPSFMALNANKRSLPLDLNQPEAADIVRRLVERADVVWENFRPGVMEKTGPRHRSASIRTKSCLKPVTGPASSKYCAEKASCDSGSRGQHSNPASIKFAKLSSLISPVTTGRRARLDIFFELDTPERYCDVTDG